MSTAYNSFDFEAHGIVMTNVDHLTVAKRNNQIEPLADRDGGILVQSQLGTKPIALEGYYIGSSISNAQTMYDTLVQILNTQQKTLTVSHAGSTRSYTCTPENIAIQEPDGLNRIVFSFQFVVPSAASEDTTPTTLINQSVTTAQSTIPFTITGSAKARPLITVTINSITGGASKTLTLRNGADLVGLTFARTFVAGDVITIDSANYQVYINNVLTVPSGKLPTWDPGSGSLYYADTFTTRSVTVLMTNYNGNL